MKTRFMFALVVALLSSSVHAALLVYREAERAHVTVAGREANVPVTNYIVYNTDTGSFDVIGYFKIGPNKHYAITNTSEYAVTQGIAGRAGTYTVLSRTVNSTADPDVINHGYFAKGRDSTLDVGNGETVTSPRSLKGITRAVQRVSGNLALYESTSTLVFQSVETKTANEAGDTGADVIERIRQRLEAQGYVPSS